MRNNVKFDVALEIISCKVADAVKAKNKKLAEQYLEEREQIYLGNWDIIEKVLQYK